MNEDKQFLDKVLEATIRIAALAVLSAWCFSIARPFLIPLVWGLILAIGTYPAFCTLRARFGGRRVLPAVLLVLLMLATLILPAMLLSGTLIDTLHALAQGFRDGSIAIPPPPESIRSWPLGGKMLFEFWDQASNNLEATLDKIAPELQSLGTWLLSTALGVGFSILQFILAILIAGVFLVHGEAGTQVAQVLARRLMGDRGLEFAQLAEATVRSVARGILGVALIQSVLIAIGFLVMEIPGAGFWALLCLILSVIQIGPLPVVIPILFYVFSTSDTGPAVLFLLWSILTGAIDNVLKPILLGRGVAVPMPVIFIGAIGGFISAGILGLFVGAVVLVLGYKLFLVWLYQTSEIS